MTKLAELKKAIVAVVGGAAELLNAGLVPDKYKVYVAAIVAIATALGVYQVTNAPAVQVDEVAPVGRHVDEDLADDDPTV